MDQGGPAVRHFVVVNPTLSHPPWPPSRPSLPILLLRYQSNVVGGGGYPDSMENETQPDLFKFTFSTDITPHSTN